MKNLPGDLTHFDAALFGQLIVEGADPETCLVRAIDDQLEMIAATSTILAPEANWLFRTVRNFGAVLTILQTSEETYRGVASWVSSIVNRKLTFKDVAR